jgi:hypothetical protein
VNLSTPVDPKQISRTDHPDFVEFHLPKLGAKLANPVPVAAQERQEGRFVDSLPHPSPATATSGKGTIG